MLDFIGQEVEADDFVATSTSKSANLIYGRVVRLTPKGCTIKYIGRPGIDNPDGIHTKSCASCQIVKISAEDAIMLKLQGKVLP